MSIDDEAIAAVLMEELEAADAAAGIQPAGKPKGSKKRSRKQAGASAAAGHQDEMDDDDEELLAGGLSRAEIAQMRLRARGATLGDEEEARQQVGLTAASGVLGRLDVMHIYHDINHAGKGHVASPLCHACAQPVGHTCQFKVACSRALRSI